jgi:Family of unknown function (DUF6522)
MCTCLCCAWQSKRFKIVGSVSVTEIAFQDGAICIDATVIAQGLGIEAASVQSLMRRGEITSLCEAGADEDALRHRLTFFGRGRRFRLVVNETGKIIARSVIDFGDRPLPAALHKPGA